MSAYTHIAGHSYASRLAAGAMVKSTYGFEIQSSDDAYVRLAIEALTSVVSLGLIGATTVDVLPFCEIIMMHWDSKAPINSLHPSTLVPILDSRHGYFETCKRGSHTY